MDGALGINVVVNAVIKFRVNGVVSGCFQTVQKSLLGRIQIAVNFWIDGVVGGNFQTVQKRIQLLFAQVLIGDVVGTAPNKKGQS